VTDIGRYVQLIVAIYAPAAYEISGFTVLCTLVGGPAGHSIPVRKADIASVGLILFDLSLGFHRAQARCRLGTALADPGSGDFVETGCDNRYPELFAEALVDPGTGDDKRIIIGVGGDDVP
jgi:hypothetical protein